MTGTAATLKRLTDLFGVQRSYRAASGEMVQTRADALVAALQALSGHASDDMDALLQHAHAAQWQQRVPPVIVAWNGKLSSLTVRLSASAARARIAWEIALEDGRSRSGSINRAQRTPRQEVKIGRTRFIELSCDVELRLPLGYHQLELQCDDGNATALLIAAPERCHDVARPREWGVFAPLYALRRARQEPVGDFSDLEQLMQWLGDRAGDVVATLPVSASFLRAPFDPSPYSPASRLFWNELYVTLEPLAQTPDIRKAARSELVDYRVAADAKRAQLAQHARQFFRHGEQNSAAFRDFLKLYPEARHYAQFRAAGERFECGWPAWPKRERAGQLGKWHEADGAARYHLYSQFVAHTQLQHLADSSAACGVRLYLDLPLGVHPDSYDVWRNPELFVTGASAGAPPDPFFTKGQDWGFPPLNPHALRAQGYRYWRSVLQTQLRYAGILRLDHVMGLHRLYFVPRGFEASAGAYVRYPADELYAVLTLESVRHQAMIVGEDLGTVPAEVRKSMAKHNVKRMFVVQFEASDNSAQPLPAVPKNAVACLNTHDMPPFHAYWEALDADLRRELDLIDDAGVRATRETRERTAHALSRQLGSDKTLSAGRARTELLRHLAASEADLVLLNLEDLWLETEPQNVPGTSDERPNWRRRLKHTLPEMQTDKTVLELLELVERERRG